MTASDAALAALEDDAVRSDASACLLLKDGETVWSYSSDASDEDELFHTASVTKFVGGLCVARALYLGQLDSLDQRAATWISEWADDSRCDITLRHLLTHSSGLAVRWPHDGQDSMTAAAVALPVVAAPGERVAYNNLGAQVVAEIIRRATGRPIDEYAGTNLFAPLGIERWAWNRDVDDRPFGMSALQLRAADLGRIGQLSLAGGVVDGTRLSDADWGVADRRAGRGFGLFEMLVADVDVLVNLEGARDLDDEVLNAVRDLVGRQLPINGAGSLFAALSRRLGPARVAEAWAALRRSAPGLAFARSDPQAYGHDGSGGQHLWIVPSVGGVAVRLRRFDDRTSDPAIATAFCELALEVLFAL